MINEIVSFDFWHSNVRLTEISRTGSFVPGIIAGKMSPINVLGSKIEFPILLRPKQAKNLFRRLSAGSESFTLNSNSIKTILSRTKHNENIFEIADAELFVTCAWKIHFFIHCSFFLAQFRRGCDRKTE